jgi:hypothetical protein
MRLLLYLVLLSLHDCANVKWAGGSVGNWSHPANWASGAAPGAGDDVEISNASVTSHDSSLSFQSINISSGQLFFAAKEVFLAGHALEIRDSSSVVAQHTLHASLTSLEVRCVCSLF